MSANATPRTIKDDAGIEHVVDDHGFLQSPAAVHVEISEILACDLDEFLDLISERAGFGLMTEQTYEVDPEDCAGTSLCLLVSGNVSAHLDDDA